MGCLFVQYLVLFFQTSFKYEMSWDNVMNDTLKTRESAVHDIIPRQDVVPVI